MNNRSFDSGSLRAYGWVPFSVQMFIALTLSGQALGQPGEKQNASTQSELTQRESAFASLQAIKADGAKTSKYLHAVDQLPEASLESDSPETPPQAKLEVFTRDVLPILMHACVDCHGADAQEGNIRVDTLDPNLLQGKDVDWWLEILAVLSNGEMPPPDASELTNKDRSKVVDWLSSAIQTASILRRATGGHTSFRRLTRYEYNYAMQDLLGLPWNFAKDLPPDAHSDDGFQNSSEMLHMSVQQLETYRQLARTSLRRATMPSTSSGKRPPVIRWGISMEEAANREWPKQTKQLDEIKKKFADDPEKQKQEIDRLQASFKTPPNGPHYRELSSGRIAPAKWAYNGAHYAFAPLENAFAASENENIAQRNKNSQQDAVGSDDALQLPESFDHVAVIPSGRRQYLTVELGDQVPSAGTMRVRVRASRVSADPLRVPSLQLQFGFQASNEGRAVVRVSDADTPINADSDAPQIYQWEFPLGEIYPRNSFRTVSKMGDLPSPSEYIRLVNSSVPQGGHGAIQIDYVEVTAPLYESWPTQSHQTLFFESKIQDDEATYAREILTAFLSKAWRRKVSSAEVDAKVELFDVMRSECESFEDTMVEALATVLSSPHFLYVITEDSEDSSLLLGHDLAMRLSLFLWSSVPDQLLLDLADSGELCDTEVLLQQVDRMLADPRSERFAKHYVHQWLDMQLLDFLAVDKNTDPLLKEAMQAEPIEFFQEMVRSDSSVLDFIHADYAMVNERLARHYGWSDVRGNQFRRINLDASKRRGGLLTQAGVLAMNSNGKDSHPLKRGVWLLRCLLNDPPPPPPPAVPEIDLADPEIAKLSLKEQIEDHRNHAACMSCHAKIDPWGIAFENYDALGQWRDRVNGKPVDAASLLFNNQELDGVDGLKRFLLKNRQDQFVRAMVHKIATYALGRPMKFTDHAKIDQVTASVRKQGDGLATTIKALVTSDLFRTK
ncbi:DUF1592 domain-containing protein [Stieleria marina]|uniref:Planctomycete cytochrome C n=1 Tax=Stieleria marina TaxID=1930275 RepID=A0A517NPE4_9BACT|nr:Planctomycete cytochrome C [Planctomycetes bacterium K23_9]